LKSVKIHDLLALTFSDVFGTGETEGGGALAKVSSATCRINENYTIKTVGATAYFAPRLRGNVNLR
jgi:hypothetical protein